MTLTESRTEIPERLEIYPSVHLHLKYGSYLVESEIGKGGYGTVYKISNQNGSKYALKVLTLWEQNPNEFNEIIAKFLQEFKIGHTASPFLVKFHHLGFIGGNPYIIMDFYKNGSLSKHLDRFTTEQMLRKLTFQCLSGLEALHRNGVIHRDVKPDNILLDNQFNAKITDFGISADVNYRMTKVNMFGRVKNTLPLTVLYCAPEQHLSSKAFKYTKPSMDIFSLGVSLYYVATNGVLPYKIKNNSIENRQIYITQKREGNIQPIQVYNPWLSTNWYSFFDKCLRPKAEDRFQTAMEALQHMNLEYYNPEHEATIWTSEPSLKVLEGERAGETISLTQLVNGKNNNLLKIGRDKQNDIILKEYNPKYVSKKHATIEKISNVFYIRDGQFSRNEDGTNWIKSFNGTLLNNKKLYDSNPYKLSSGDIIKLGSYTLKFYEQ